MGGRVVGAEAVMAEQSTGRGRRGVVVAAAPGAAAVGAEAMRAGGNAYDAAVAALLAETVLLPPKCGLAGDVIALAIEPGDAEPTALLAIGGAPRRLADAVRRDRRLPDTGPLSVGVPGAPAGYAALAARAVLPLARLAAPAIALARDGLAWAPICSLLCEESAGLVAQHNPGGTSYFPGGRPPEPGDVVALPGLARVLDAFVDAGADLYAGELGALVAERVQRAGGVIEHDDLTTARAEWCAPAHVRAVNAGWEVWATPAPTHGPSLLDAVASLDGPDADAGAVLRAVREAAARRRATLGDPMVAASTSMVSAADSDGRAVVVIHSNSYPRFGSGLVVDELDLILANRAGRGFTAEEGHPNFPLPGRRPATTLHAWAAGPSDGDDGVTHLGATPGGVNQMPWNAQTLRDLFAGRADHGGPGALTVAPKWEWLPGTGEVRAEDDVASRDAESLRAIAPVSRVERWALRSATQVVERPVPGRAVVGGVDPRTGGLALGV